MNPQLFQTAQALVAPGKGILAADESTPTIKKRFDSIGAKSTEESRRSYREMLFSAPRIDKTVSGVILFDETLRQATLDGQPFVEFLKSRNIIPGIKVDKGAKALAGFDGEKVTEGLDGLRERLEEYKTLGAQFAKWRAVIDIDNKKPSMGCIKANAHALARYAALCQEVGLVPIVEPEVLMDGDHAIERCAKVTERVLRNTYRELALLRVELEGTLLKPNMVISGKGCAEQASTQQVAEWTVQVLRRTVPAAVPGIVFLSGGQSAEQATENLNAMNQLANEQGGYPWQLSFSFGRALQAPALTAWAGKTENHDKAQQAFQQVCEANHLARSGQFLTKAA
ncbi:MAG: fructose-bisphosphate aldolase class I [Gammaproteobacteria bacterium]|nr:fructose-bisphosphate aldolase class I [Gammaproteobacteria bacterium]